MKHCKDCRWSKYESYTRTYYCHRPQFQNPGAVSGRLAHHLRRGAPDDENCGRIGLYFEPRPAPTVEPAHEIAVPQPTRRMDSAGAFGIAFICAVLAILMFSLSRLVA